MLPRTSTGQHQGPLGALPWGGASVATPASKGRGECKLPTQRMTIVSMGALTMNFKSLLDFQNFSEKLKIS